jgi:hypothetical protein
MFHHNDLTFLDSKDLLFGLLTLRVIVAFLVTDLSLCESGPSIDFFLDFGAKLIFKFLLFLTITISNLEIQLIY